MSVRKLLHALLRPVLLGTIAWGCAALWIDGPASRPVTGVLAGGSVVAAYGVPFLVVLGWWLSIPPSNDRHRQRDVAALATASIDGDRVTIRNLRNFEVRSAGHHPSLGTSMPMFEIPVAADNLSV